jgi:hypothetical protein
MLHSNAGEAGDPPLPSLVFSVDAADVSDSMRVMLFFLPDVNCSAALLPPLTLSGMWERFERSKIIFSFVLLKVTSPPATSTRLFCGLAGEVCRYVIFKEDGDSGPHCGSQSRTLSYWSSSKSLWWWL